MTDHFSGAVTAPAERASVQPPPKQPASKFCWRRANPNPGRRQQTGGGGGVRFMLGSKDKLKKKQKGEGRAELLGFKVLDIKN